MIQQARPHSATAHCSFCFSSTYSGLHRLPRYSRHGEGRRQAVAEPADRHGRRQQPGPSRRTGQHQRLRRSTVTKWSDEETGIANNASIEGLDPRDAARADEDGRRARHQAFKFRLDEREGLEIGSDSSPKRRATLFALNAKDCRDHRRMRGNFALAMKLAESEGRGSGD